MGLAGCDPGNRACAAQWEQAQAGAGIDPQIIDLALRNAGFVGVDPLGGVLNGQCVEHRAFIGNAMRDQHLAQQLAPAPLPIQRPCNVVLADVKLVGQDIAQQPMPGRLPVRQSQGTNQIERVRHPSSPELTAEKPAMGHICGQTLNVRLTSCRTTAFG